MTALERYLDPRIGRVVELSIEPSLPFYIFSGVYGLVRGDDLVPYYDHALEENEVPAMAKKLGEQLAGFQITTLRFYGEGRSAPGWKPYYMAIEQACNASGTRLVEERVPGPT